MFEPITGMDGVYSATRGKLRCVAIRLQSGGWCLFSPVAGLEQEAQALGQITYILAPNQYHNKGIAGHHALLPQAALIAPQACRDRLARITGARFTALEEATLDLPDGVRILAPEGLKTGEVWIVAGDGLIVVDAFAGEAKESDTPQLLKTFPRYGVADQPIYAAWVAKVMAAERPTILVPCHGGIVRNAALPELLVGLASA